MIYVGIDDTDTLDSPGTNQLARHLAGRLNPRYRCLRIVRHQLLFDPRVPYTRKNGSASLVLEPQGPHSVEGLRQELLTGMRAWFHEGSDPGLCVTEEVPTKVAGFGRRCQRDLVVQQEARDLAAECGIYLEGIGGTEDGVIGALAAVGLSATGDDGRVIQIGSWPDDLCGLQDIAALEARDVRVQCADSGEPVTHGLVDVGKHLRPNYRGGKIVLFVVPAPSGLSSARCWQAIRLP